MKNNNERAFPYKNYKKKKYGLRTEKNIITAAIYDDISEFYGFDLAKVKLNDK